MTIRIERGVRMPLKRGHGKYPFRDMRVGDSFLVPLALNRAIRTAAGNAGRRHGMKFVTRLSCDVKGNPVGVRVWRTE